MSRIIGHWLFGLVATPLLLAAHETRADDWADCSAASGSADKVIAACTAVIDQAARSKADLATAYGRRGTQLNRLGQKDRAFQDFTRSVELNPANPAGYMFRGTSYAERREWAKALAEFDQALARSPNDPRIHTARGRALVDSGRVDAGIASHNRAIATSRQAQPLTMPVAITCTDVKSFTQAPFLYIAAVLVTSIASPRTSSCVM